MHTIIFNYTSSLVCECHPGLPLTAVDCGTLSSPANGDVDFGQTTLRSVATYSCNAGYDLVGVESVTCQTNGMWSAGIPECTRKQVNHVNFEFMMHPHKCVYSHHPNTAYVL